MQVIYVINVVLIFFITGVLLHDVYSISGDKVVEFNLLDNVEFVKSSDNFSGDLKNKISLVQVDNSAISVVDLQDWYYRLLKQEESLKSKETLLRDVEKHNNEQILYLENVKKVLASLVKVDDQKERIHSLVKIYENMPVELAAEIFGLLDINSLMSIANNIDRVTLSNILLHVSPNVTEMIKKASTSVSKCDCSSNIS
ncbi:MotE family protein [Ehrlichia canis]|uniref:Uncharacterized protein n=1 Tax=Ehrlichia canis (strain Jake) TaxID=269484 RepID=A0ACA6AV95_EHRCJ|nr:hypothetical protein [Ehrlichia canis]AAZ68227.1 hypothetical protein Ecaj_0176 [Ehrlichia canis str. Jake]UKC53588.1 hypothetical protein s20019040002_000631 [Ehrlichia canis]UKC54526.1 hypothetical protein s20026770001_000632 [Ehrlichia canis]UKC55462.1 hypothetical protein s21009500007_000632 [Ehrlichia canis]